MENYISSLILLPISAITAGTSSFISTAASGIGQAALRAGGIAAFSATFQFVTLPIQIEMEVWEELHLDPWIESLMYKWGNFFGWSDSTSGLLGSLICSFREAFMGAASYSIKSMRGRSGGSTGSISSSSIDYTLDATGVDLQALSMMNAYLIGQEAAIDFGLESHITSMSEERVASQISALKSAKETVKLSTWAVAKRILSFAKLIPSFTVGAGASALMTSVLDVSVNYIFDMEKIGLAFRNRKITKEIRQLTGQQIKLETASNELQALIISEQSSVSNFRQITDPSNPFSALASSAQLQGQIETQNFLSDINLGITTAYNDFMKQKQEVIKTGQQEIGEIADSENSLMAQSGHDSRVAVSLVDPYYKVLAEITKGIRNLERNTYINPTKNTHQNKLFIKALLGIRGKVYIAYKGHVIESGLKLSGFGTWVDSKYGVKSHGDVITDKTPLKYILEFLGYDFDLHTEPIYIIPISQRHNPTFNHIINNIGRIFEGSGNIIKSFATENDFDILIDFQNDIVEDLREKMKTKFRINKDNIKNLLLATLYKKFQSDTIQELLKDESPRERYHIKMKMLNYFVTRFIDPLSSTDKDIDEFINIRLDETIYVYLMKQFMNKPDTNTMALEFEQFHADFLEWLDDDPSHPELNVINKDLFTDGINLFIQNFIQSYYTPAHSFGPAFNRNPQTFIGEIYESLTMSGLAVEQISAAFTATGFQDFDIIHCFQPSVSISQQGFLGDANTVEIIGDYKKTKLLDNNDIDIINSEIPSFRNFYDVLYLVSNSRTLGFEVKNSRYLNDLLAIHDAGMDHLRTVYFDKYYSIGNTLSSTPTKNEFIILPLDSDKGNLIWNEIFEVNDPVDLQHYSLRKGQFIKSGDRKGDIENLVYLEITKLLNKYLHTFQKDQSISDAKQLLQQILSRINSKPLGPIMAPSTYSIYNDIRSTVKNVFKVKALGLTNRFYEEVANTFSRSLDKLLKRTDTGFELVWYEALQCHLDSGVILRPSLLPSNNEFLVFDKDGPKTLSHEDLRDENYFITQDTPFIWIHRIHKASGSISNGIMRVDTFNELFEDSEYIYREGYYDSNTGLDIKGSYICNEEGTLLLSRVGLEDSESFIRPIDWYKNTIEDKATNTDLFFNGEIINAPKLTYWRALVKVTGGRLVSFLQKVESIVIPLNEYESCIQASISNIKSMLKEMETGVIPNPAISHVTLLKAQGLSNVIHQLGKTFFTKDYIPRLIVTREFLNLHAAKPIYSIPQLRGVLEDMRPRSNDALYDPTSPIYSSESPHHESSNSLYWLNMISRFSLTDTEIVPRGFSDKQLYNCWLLLIQNDLLIKDEQSGEWILNPNSAFIDYRHLVVSKGGDFNPVKLSTGSTLTDSDLTIIRDQIEKAMINYMGFPAYACLISYVLTFSEDTSGDLKLDFIVPRSIEQYMTLYRTNVRPLHNLRDYFGSQKPHPAQYSYDFEGQEFGYLSVFFTSIYMGGFWRNLDGTDYKLTTIPDSNAFLEKYFELYAPSSRNEHFKSVQVFLLQECSKFDRQYEIKQHTFGRGNILGTLSRCIDNTLNTIFQPLGSYKNYPQFANDRVSWKLRTAKMAKSLLRFYLDSPTKTYDFVEQLKEIYYSGKDGYITIQATKNKLYYGSNDLIDQGLRIFVPFSEIEEIINDIYYTLLFRSHSNAHKQITPSGYFLDFDLLFPGHEEKFMHMFNTFYDMFTTDGNDKYELHFFVEHGHGITFDSKITDSYTKLGITESVITINVDPNNDLQLKSDIASIIFYMFALQDVFVVAKKNKFKNLFYADIFGLYSEDYVKSTDYSKVVGGTIEGVWTVQEYRAWSAEFKDLKNCFKDSDIRNFLYFYNRESNSDMFEYLYTIFQGFFKTRINTGININRLGRA